MNNHPLRGRHYLLQISVFLVCSGVALSSCDDAEVPRGETAGSTQAGEEVSGEEMGGAAAGEMASGELAGERGGDQGVYPWPPYQVQTELGLLQGRGEETPYGEAISFRGVPFAQPPIGALRLRPPQPIQAWEGLLDATEFGPACPQRGALTSSATVQDEDCLTLNVWTPAEAGGYVKPQEARPVMVWLHGGGFTQGSGSFNLYNGARLARRGDVVVVTLNYRLGVLGFLNTRRLDPGSGSGTRVEREGEDEALTHARQVGNFGIQDQLLALTWVQKHIPLFGGDPQNITIFGESAGGFSVCALLANPLAWSLFHQAIIQSGGGCDGFETLSTDGGGELETRATQVLNALGCGELSGEDLHLCLQEKSSDDFLDAAAEAGKSVFGLDQLGPAVDGELILGGARELLSDGTSPARPIMTGSNADEMTLFTFNVPIGLGTFNLFVEGTFGALASSIFDLYPATDDMEAKDAYNQLLSDIIFICPTLAFASDLSNSSEVQRAQTWVYHFDHSLSNGLPAALGATHALEIPFVFNNHHISLYGATATERDIALSDLMADAWISFARDHAPQSETSPSSLQWPSYLSASTDQIDAGRVMLWRAESQLQESPIREGRCDALAALGFFNPR